MKTWIAMIVLLSALGAGCKGADKSEGGGAKSSAQSEEVAVEMNDFMKSLNGNHEAVAAALASHGEAGLDTREMELYDLDEPRVAKREGDCYTLEAKSGLTVRTYVLCWKDGKIASVEFTGMK